MDMSDKCLETKSVVVNEEAVLVYIKLSDSEFGTWEDRERCYALEDALLEELIKQEGIGELDGHEFGEGYCVFYIYGNSADCLYDSIKTIISTFNLLDGSYVIIRYGGPGAPEKRINEVVNR